jgi:hypothetical protein
MAPFMAQGWKNIATHVGVGMGAASFWRGAWYVLDDHLFPDDPARSAAASWGLGVVGMAASQGLVQKCEVLQQRGVGVFQGLPLKVARFGALYTIALSCVLVWRGTWLGWDVLYEYTHPKQTPCKTAVKSTDPGHLSTSGMLSHVLAVTALVGTGLFASVLAPPAATSIIRDWTVRTGAKPYNGPAGKLVQSFWHSPKPTPNPNLNHNPSTVHAVVSRNYQTQTISKGGGFHTNTNTPPFTSLSSQKQRQHQPLQQHQRR